jgi:3-mercaptopropionate dioxygenase
MSEQSLTPSVAVPNYQRLRHFVSSFAALLEREPDEAGILDQGSALLEQLVAVDDWLPAAYAQPDPQRYRQYLLHVDSAQRFCVVSFVWGPGQQTPVHDHTVWGLIGMLRGAEDAQSYRWQDGVLAPYGVPLRLQAGDVEAVSPNVDGLDDIHRVSNVYDDRVSISIHVYGANIGAVRRSVYLADGDRKEFISGYSNTTLPNIWDLSLETSTT